MSISVVRFERDKHLDAASEMLAQRQRRYRAFDPLLPAAFDGAEACRQLIAPDLDQPGCFGVFATEGGAPAGFAIGTTVLVAPTHMMAGFFPPRCANIAYSAHAAASADSAYEVYREMYAVLAAHFVSAGYFDHIVHVSPSDAAVCDAWSSLGFGRALTAAMRGVEPLDRPAAGVQLSQAGAEDAEVVFALNEELLRHHARAPIFQPMLRETEHSSHDFSRDLLKEPDVNAHWIAYDGDRPLGMNTFMPPFWISPLLAPEQTVYLYQGVVSEEARRGGVGAAILARGIDWARDQGYRQIALHFAAANVAGAKFWQSSGFRPIEHRVHRRIDERIAWAGG